MLGYLFVKIECMHAYDLFSFPISIHTDFEYLPNWVIVSKGKNLILHKIHENANLWQLINLLTRFFLRLERLQAGPARGSGGGPEAKYFQNYSIENFFCKSYLNANKMKLQCIMRELVI